MQEDQLNDLRNHRVQKTPARRRARKFAQSSGGKPVAGAIAHGCHRLYVVRESGEYALMLMIKMIQQILWPHRDHASVEAALSYGVTPLKKTEEAVRLREVLKVRVLHSREGRTKELGVLFSIGEDWFLYVLSSAGKTTGDGENEFTDVLLDIIKELRPAELVTGPFSRIVRRGDLAGRIAHLLKTRRTLVRTYETPAGIDLNTPGGDGQWQALARGAEADYLAGLTRLLTGVVYEVNRNRYPRSKNSLPIGYGKPNKTGPEKHAVAYVEEERSLVRRFIELAASDMAEADIAEELSALGLTARHSRYRQGGKRVPADQVENPGRLVAGIFQHLPVYLEGTYRFKHEMTLPNVDDFHGLTVHRASPDDYGYITADLKLGVPPGGWHDRDLILRAIHRRLVQPKTNPRAPHNRDLVKPLAGVFHWVDDTYEYFVHSSDDSAYTLRRRPLGEAFDKASGARQGFDDDEGELLARFPSNYLHDRVAALMGTVESGLPSDQGCPNAPAPAESVMEDLRVRAKQAAAKAAEAMDEVLRVEGEQAKNHYRAIAKEEEARATELRAQLVELQRPASASAFGLLNADELAAATAMLKATQDRADVALNSTLRRVFRAPRIEAAPREPLARLTLSLEAATTDGAIRLGPASIWVVNGAVGVGPKHAQRKSSFVLRNRRILELLLLDMGDADQKQALWDGEGFDARNFLRRMAAALDGMVPTRQAISALIDCPITGVRRAVLGPLLGLDLDHGLPEDLAAHLTRLYGDQGFWWPHGWCPGGMTRRRSVLRFLDAHAPDADAGLDGADVRRCLALDYGTYYGYLHDSSTRASYHRGLTPTYRIIEDVDGWLARSRSRFEPHRVRIRLCPHCGARKLIQPLKVPEVPGQLLCVECRCEPATGLRFPQEFFLPWDGPQTLPRRNGAGPTTGGRHGATPTGRVIVGTDLYEPVIPSLHAPRLRSDAPKKPAGGTRR